MDSVGVCAASGSGVWDYEVCACVCLFDAAGFLSCHVACRIQGSCVSFDIFKVTTFARWCGEDLAGCESIPKRKILFDVRDCILAGCVGGFCDGCSCGCSHFALYIFHYLAVGVYAF